MTPFSRLTWSFAVGACPQPVATSLRVPIDRVEDFQVGCEAPVELWASDASILDIDWAGLIPSTHGPGPS